jgi:glyoxylase-like metal-dependent hydrolase (beta-lactamase superfamily II)
MKMRGIDRLAVGVSIFLLFVAGGASAASPANASLDAYHKAREVIDAAVEASGGADRINGISSVVTDRKGTAWARNQSPKVAKPFEANEQSGRVILDLEGGRLVAEISGGFPGGVFANRTVITDDDKFVLNLTAKTIQRNDTLEISNFDFWHRLFPPLMLRKALQQASSLRWLGRAELDGRQNDIVSFAWDNGTLTPTLYIDSETHMVTKYELLFPDNLTGDGVSELYFPGYRTVEGIQVPVGYRQIVGGTLAADLSYTKVSINQPIDDKEFEVPFGYRDIAPPPIGTPKVVELAKDVYMVEGLANFGYNFFFVAFDEYIMAYDASVSRAVSAQAIAQMKSAVPDKPIRYLVLSHHHDDHAGGIRAFVDEGATVVTTAANRSYLEKMASTVATLGGGGPAGETGEPNFEFVDGKRVFKDDGHVVEIYDIGPSPHAEEMLVFYLPKEKTLFEADLLGIPRSGPPAPANDVTVHFAEAIRKLGLEVEMLGGVHGTVGTMADLEDALRRRKMQ